MVKKRIHTWRKLLRNLRLADIHRNRTRPHRDLCQQKGTSQWSSNFGFCTLKCSFYVTSGHHNIFQLWIALSYFCNFPNLNLKLLHQILHTPLPPPIVHKLSSWFSHFKMHPQKVIKCFWLFLLPGICSSILHQSHSTSLLTSIN